MMLTQEQQRVVLAGRVDASTVGRVRERLHAAIEGGEGVLVVDLAAVDVLDATGLGMLVASQRLAVRSGRILELQAVPPRVHRLLQITRLSRVLPVQRPPVTAG